MSEAKKTNERSESSPSETGVPGAKPLVERAKRANKRAERALKRSFISLPFKREKQRKQTSESGDQNQEVRREKIDQCIYILCRECIYIDPGLLHKDREGRSSYQRVTATLSILYIHSRS